jgi:peptide/nickel transport system permease protein
MGFGDLYVIGRHILPNIVSTIIVISTFDMAWFILYEATISFIGLGNPTIPSWGRLLYIGRGFLGTQPWISVFPGVFICLTVLSFNLLGDSLSDFLTVKR